MTKEDYDRQSSPSPLSGDPTEEYMGTSSLLDELVAKCIVECDEGRNPNLDLLCLRYPKIAKDLKAALANHVGASALVRPAAARTPCPSYSIGSVLAGRFRVFGTAAGGMGWVYFVDDLEAEKRGHAQRFALKTVPDEATWAQSLKARGHSPVRGAYKGVLARFRQEAMTWNRLPLHPNIVAAYFVIEIGDQPYLQLEYANAGSLDQWIRNKRLDYARAIDFALQACRGLAHAGRTASLVHRDLKPANILIHDDRIAKVADFGLASVPFDNPMVFLGTEHPATHGGTDSYKAPEQREGHTDVRSDIYSFGLVFYEMLTGHKPDPMPVTAHSFLGFVPAICIDIISRCLEAAPNNRFQSFSELAESLEDCADCTTPNPPAAIEYQSDLNADQRIVGDTFSLLSLGDFAAAAQLAQNGIDLAPDNWAHWHNLGKALIELTRGQEAVSSMERAVELAPDRAHPWSNLAWARLLNEECDTALAAADRAIDLSPEFHEAWHARGVCEERLGMIDAAIRSLAQATVLQPADWKVWANLARCLSSVRRYSDAAEAFTRVLEISPDAHDERLWLGVMQHQLSRLPEALETARQYTERCPELAAGYALQAAVLWDMGRSDDAMSHLKRAVELNPTDSMVLRVQAAIDR